jgi:fructose-1,6-bisphosphatase/inositol monophosphatase family enzyme
VVVHDEVLLEVLNQTVDAVRLALTGLEDWGLAGTHAGQYRSDLVADRAAIAVLDRAGLVVLSEESGLRRPEREIIVALDPVDGSTNASRGLPWYATSVGAIDNDGPRAAVVLNQATGTRFEAVRGGGARRDGQPIAPSGQERMRDSLVALSGLPARHLGWKQFRALGAAALDLCAVASGAVDAYIDCSRDAHGPWDYLGALLVCTEAGVKVTDAHGRDLITLGHGDRRTPVAAATERLHEEALAARRSLD